MNHALEQMLLKNGASMVGFAELKGLYAEVDRSVEQTVEEEKIRAVPHYPAGISIALAYPKNIIRGIDKAPTMEYHDAYHELNRKLDELAVLCARYIEASGYHAHPQLVATVKEFGLYRTVMPHKTVAVRSGLGWIGKSSLFITERYGSAIRLTSVLTDAPIQCTIPVIESKCGGCMLCVQACPGGAISGRNWNPELDRDDLFDARACRKKARELAAKTLNKEITLCGKCIEVCPYTKRFLNT